MCKLTESQKLTLQVLSKEDKMIVEYLLEELDRLEWYLNYLLNEKT
jgi:hypothetical protein